jgi:hypothetical protein
MMHLRVVLLALAIALVPLSSGCGSDGSGGSRSAPSEEGTASNEGGDDAGQSSAEERLDESIERTLERRKRAAAAGDRAAVAQAESRLDELAERLPEPNTGPPPSDPFERLLEAFEFKTAPLYVETITSTEDSPRLFVSVDKNAFCLKTPAVRRRAVEAVYLSADKLLRARGVNDFDFVLVPTATAAPTTRMALARGHSGRLRMIAAPRGC